MTAKRALVVGLYAAGAIEGLLGAALQLTGHHPPLALAIGTVSFVVAARLLEFVFDLREGES